MVEVGDIERASERISPFVLKTPLETAQLVSDLVGGEVLLKMEQLQPTGSFKIRGATNKLLTIPGKQLKRGLVAASTGNHGAAVARAARTLGAHAIVYVPETTSQNKVRAIEEHGAEVRYAGRDGVEAEIEARRYALERALDYVSPYNDEAVIAGQGTIGFELFRQAPELSAVYVSVGGGGLASGIATYLKSVKHGTSIVACSPEASAVMYHSVQAGRILEMESRETISDGTAGGVESDALTFDICRRLVDRWLLVPETAIESALRLAINRLHLRIEASAALALAGLMMDDEFPIGRQAVAIMCGGNISGRLLERILSKGSR